MDSRPHILVVDPIFRGSRLMYSAYAAEALVRRGARVTVLARVGEPPSQYGEYFRSVPHELRAEIKIPADVWYRKLTRDEIADIFSKIGSIQKSGSLSAVFFSGLNEFFPALASLQSVVRPHAAATPLFFVDYAPGCWLRLSGRGLRGCLVAALKRMAYRRMLAALAGLHLFVLDERLRNSSVSLAPQRVLSRMSFLPEAAPWMENPPPLREPGHPTVLLVVGQQSRRKGLADVVGAAQAKGFPEDWKVHLVGRLGADTEHLRSQMERLSRSSFMWDEAYLSDAEIRLRYSETDYVALPYTREFDATSSVLAWACAHGKPVVGTSHGLVGYRIQTHGLGATYNSGDTLGFLRAIGSAPKPGSRAYEETRDRCLRYAYECREERFQEILAEAILGSQVSRQPVT